MLEREVKVIGADKERVIGLLQSLGASYEGEELQKNYVMDSSRQPLGDQAYLRLRVVEVGGKVVSRELTLKERLPDRQNRLNRETSVAVNDEEACLLLFQKLGYDQIKLGEKQRQTYRLGDCLIQFDCWDRQTLSFPYMEIEAPSAERLQQVLGELEIDPALVSLLSIKELQALDRGEAGSREV